MAGDRDRGADAHREGAALRLVRHHLAPLEGTVPQQIGDVAPRPQDQGLDLALVEIGLARGDHPVQVEIRQGPERLVKDLDAGKAVQGIHA